MILKRLMPGAMLMAFFASLAIAQIPRSKVYSRPAAPSDEALRRLNLVQSWTARTPMDGRRDSLLRLELDRNDLIAVTRSGQVVRFDAETGVQRWRARAGKPYTMLPFFAANSRSIYVIANATIYALDRATGSKKWDYRLPAGLSASPAVDEEQIYLPSSNNRLYTYYLPFVQSGDESERSEGLGRSPIYNPRDATEDIRPRPVWIEATNMELAFQPLQTSDTLFVLSPSGRALGISKIAREGGGAVEVFSFSTEGKISVPPGQYADTAYVGSDDATLYAINMTTGKLRWRQTPGTRISRRPVALASDVYVTSVGEGLARLDRESGEAVWRIPQGRNILSANSEADRFLAANNKFVYASDTSGRLLVLDRKRGIRLSVLATTDFRFPVVNQLSDRLYLASNDGTIICLHDRNQLKPIRHQFALEQASSPVLKKLEKKEIDPGSKEMTLREALAAIRGKYQLHFVVAERAFKEAGNANVQDRKVTIPRIENRPLKELVEKTLAQADATYQIVENTLLVVPAAKKK